MMDVAAEHFDLVQNGEFSVVISQNLIAFLLSLALASFFAFFSAFRFLSSSFLAFLYLTASSL